MNAIATVRATSPRIAAHALLAASLISAPLAMAGATFKIDDSKSITVGAGLRTSFATLEDGAPNGTDRSNNFELNSIRLYLSGKVTKDIGLVFNTERQADGVAGADAGDRSRGNPR